MAKPIYPRTIKEAGLSARLYRYDREKNGKTYVEFVLAYSNAGKPKQRSFADETDADTEARKILRDLAAGIRDGADMTATERQDFGLAQKHVAPFNLPVSTACAEYAKAREILAGKASILDAVTFFMKNANPNLPKRTVAEVADEMIAHKRDVDKVGIRHQNDLKERLPVFGRAFPERQISSITAVEINGFVFEIKGSKRLRYNYRTAIVGLFNFAKAKGYLVRDKDTEAQHSEQVKGGTKIGKVEVFTPEELRHILAKQNYKTIPFVAINCFSGVRNAEIGRLRWEHFLWNADVIHVPADKSKVGEERYVPMLPILKDWLAPYRECEGAITMGVKRIQNMAQRLAAAALTDGSGKELIPAINWKRNGLRHSYISYRLAATQNRAQVAEEAGNSVAMIKKHYKRPILPEEAASYWSLTRERASLKDIAESPTLKTKMPEENVVSIGSAVSA